METKRIINIREAPILTLFSLSLALSHAGRSATGDRDRDRVCANDRLRVTLRARVQCVRYGTTVLSAHDHDHGQSRAPTSKSDDDDVDAGIGNRESKATRQRLFRSTVIPFWNYILYAGCTISFARQHGNQR